MRFMPLVLGLALVAGTGSAFAATHSDFTKSFPLQTLKTFEFKHQSRISYRLSTIWESHSDGRTLWRS